MKRVLTPHIGKAEYAVKKIKSIVKEAHIKAYHGDDGKCHMPRPGSDICLYGRVPDSFILEES
eukprot:32944-Eustigmatos_ZCMA.PRE.1